jgi:hypothetical protein
MLNQLVKWLSVAHGWWLSHGEARAGGGSWPRGQGVRGRAEPSSVGGMHVESHARGLRGAHLTRSVESS